MEQTTLKLHEFYALEAELGGVFNRQTGEVASKGLLAENIKLPTKYWLTDLLKKVATEKESIEKLKEELIKKHGNEDEQGNVSIPMYLFKKEVDKEGNEKEVPYDMNPDYVKFDKDFNDLLQEERTIEHFAFTLDQFENVESDSNYGTFFKLIKAAE